jgi:hypothetical protein
VSVLRIIRSAYVRSGFRSILPYSLKTAVRRRWVRLARRLGYPISSPKLARPQLSPGRRKMRLTHVLLACDLNPRYLEFWPFAERAWREVAGLEPVLVLVAAHDAAPPDLAADGRVRVFPPISGVHTAFQAQCIRLLYPALLETDGAVLTSDMELAPMDPWYFHGPVAQLDERFFVAYRDALQHRQQIAIAYNAALPATWAEIFGVAGIEDVRARLAEWASDLAYDGVRGGPGWFTDQTVLYRYLMPWAARTGRLWMLDDDYTGHRRLEQPLLGAENGLTPERRREILRRRYTDFIPMIPQSEFGELNRRVVDLAVESLRGRR